MVIAIHCVVIGSLAFAYKQHSIKCKVHRWLWLLAHRYQWSTCVYYTSMLKVWALLLDSGISIIQTMNITRPLWGIYMVLNVVNKWKQDYYQDIHWKKVYVVVR